MAQRVNKVIPSNNGIDGYLENSSIYRLVSNVAKEVDKYNHSKQVERNFILLRDMLSIADGSDVVLENDADKIIRQTVDIAMSELTYDDKISLINNCFTKQYRAGRGNGGTPSLFKNMWDVAKAIVDYVDENKMVQFTDAEIGQFKQVYNSLLVIYPEIEKIVNKDIKGLWQAYRSERDRDNGIKIFNF